MSRRAAPQLPSHLSYKSALVLLPPSSIEAPIESLRKKHDRNFHRWPPHINLIYPFLNQPSSSLQTIKTRIQGAVGNGRHIELCLSSAGHFLHSKSSATVWLQPSEKDGANTSTCQTLLDLQAELQKEFAECNADDRPFTPHLSVGQARGGRAAEGLKAEVDQVMTDFVKTSSSTSQGPHEFNDSGHGDWQLDWTVDRVFVIERQGFKDRFKIVEEVLLSETAPK